MKKMMISIPEPCHEDWNKMTAMEKGRFCGSCQKMVTDFTGMTDTEIISFFRKRPGPVCGRFQQEQLHRDIVLPRKRLPWISYFFRFALPAFLISLKSYGQKEGIRGKVAVVCSKDVKGDTLTVWEHTSEKKALEVKGRVLDENGDGVPFATVMIKGTNRGVACDSSGSFSINSGSTAGVILVASAIGYKSEESRVEKISGQEIVLKMHTEMTGGVVVVAGLVARRPFRPMSIIEKITDTAFSRFSIYPNPIQSHSSVRLNTKKLKRGNYLLFILSTAGETVQTGNIKVETKDQVHSIQLSAIARGAYLLNVTDKVSGKIYTEKLIVQ